MPGTRPSVGSSCATASRKPLAWNWMFDRLAATGATTSPILRQRPAQRAASASTH